MSESSVTQQRDLPEKQSGRLRGLYDEDTDDKQVSVPQRRLGNIYAPAGRVSHLART